MKTTRPTIKATDGFTLVELLIYMMLLGVAMASIYSVFISNVKSHASQENSIEMIQDLRGSIDIMVREIRMAGCNPMDKVLTPPIGFTHTQGTYGDAEDQDTDADSIHFTMDIDDDEAITSSNEDITYYLDESENVIRRRTAITGTFDRLAENITGLVFQYYKSDGTELVNPTAGQLADIHTVLITITAETDQVDPNTLQKKDRVISTRVRVRNAGT